MMMKTSQAGRSDRLPTLAEDSSWTGANLGEMTLEMLMAAGIVLPSGERITCETDYLAMRGKKFPEDVTRSEMEDFNRRTLKPVMDEAAERKRYEAIAEFFKRGVK